ncbi:hypothetical protein [Tenacibaculum sp. C7A-26P2]|uniref:hypothetical protein n=1 Tax=Tenacibaculum sp. C7A-26P2 TaxID=3447504 RepID=UPI003F825F5A
MKNIVLFLLLIISVSLTYGQVIEHDFTDDENEIISNIINEEGFDKFLELAKFKTDFLVISIDYNNNTYFSGRDVGIDQFNIAPQITYFNSLGLFLNFGATYFSEFDPKWDFTSISLGYGNNIVKSNRLRWSVSYDRYFYNNPEYNPFKNSFNAGVEFDNKGKSIGADIIFSYLFGSENASQFVFGGYKEFKFFEKGSSQFKLKPELRVTVGQQTVQLARTFTFRGRQITLYQYHEDYGLVNTQLYVPIQYSNRNFDIDLGYVFNIPSAFEGEENLSSTNTFSISISYVFDFN